MRWKPTQAREGRQRLESPLTSHSPSTCSGVGGGLGCPTRARGSEAGRACSRLRPPTGGKGDPALQGDWDLSLLPPSDGGSFKAFTHSLTHSLTPLFAQSYLLLCPRWKL